MLNLFSPLPDFILLDFEVTVGHQLAEPLIDPSLALYNGLVLFFVEDYLVRDLDPRALEVYGLMDLLIDGLLDLLLSVILVGKLGNLVLVKIPL